MDEITGVTPRDRLIADARNVPQLIALAKTSDPPLAQALEGKALVSSKSVYGPAVSVGITWIVARYGLGWDDSTVALVSGLVVLAVSAALRLVSYGPITGFFTKGTPK